MLGDVTVGVPEIEHVVGFSTSPAGKLGVTEQELMLPEKVGVIFTIAPVVKV